MRFFKRKRAKWLLAPTLAGTLMLAGAALTRGWVDTQYLAYDLGVIAYKSGDLKHAVEFFDSSIAAYRSNTNASGDWLHRHFFPGPDRVLAARADHFKAEAFLQAKKPELAVTAYQESLELNPGNHYETIPDFKDMTQAEIKPVFREAMDVKYDLEALYRNHPELAQGSGQGKPGDGPPSQKMVPGTDPGSQPGKGNRDDL